MQVARRGAGGMQGCRWYKAVVGWKGQQWWNREGGSRGIVTGVACARDGLHGHDEHGIKWTKSVLKYSERDSYACGSTVSVGDDEAMHGAWCNEGLLV